jgi:hypothetical protein
MPAKSRLKVQLLLLIAAFSIITLFTCCNPSLSKSNDNTITCNYHLGTWHSVGMPNSISITFTPDTLKYNIPLNGEDFAFINNEYAYLACNDTLFIQTIEETPMRLLMLRTGQDHSVLAIFKAAKGTEDHIALAFLIEKETAENNQKESDIVSENIRQRLAHTMLMFFPLGSQECWQSLMIRPMAFYRLLTARVTKFTLWLTMMISS